MQLPPKGRNFEETWSAIVSSIDKFDADNMNANKVEACCNRKIKTRKMRAANRLKLNAIKQNTRCSSKWLETLVSAERMIGCNKSWRPAILTALDKVEEEMKVVGTEKLLNMVRDIKYKLNSSSIQNVREEIKAIILDVQSEQEKKFRDKQIAQKPASMHPRLHRSWERKSTPKLKLEACQIHSSNSTADLVFKRKQLSRTAVSRDNRASVRSSYHELLIQNGSIGAWQESCRTYSAMRKSGVVIDVFTFKLLLISCKNATPPQATEAIKIYRLMKKNRLAPTLSILGILIEVCGSAGQWRQAISVFKELTSTPYNLAASTSTYDGLSKVI